MVVVQMPSRAFDYSSLPTDYLQEGVRHYMEDRLPPGGFLRAVISNDLTQAVLQADHWNQRFLKDIVLWFVRHAPNDSWGSPEKYEAWLGENKE